MQALQRSDGSTSAKISTSWCYFSGGGEGLNEVDPCLLYLGLRSGGVLREAEGHVMVQ